jgi:tetratricopeptide (TPR) repeat protein
MDTLVAIGKVLGLSGVGVSVFFLLTKAIIEKRIYPQLTKDKSYQLLRLIVIIVFCFSVIVLIFVAIYQIIGGRDVKVELRQGTMAVVLLATRESLVEKVRSNSNQGDTRVQKTAGTVMMDVGSAYRELADTVVQMNNLVFKYESCIGPVILSEIKVETPFAKSRALQQAFEKLAGECPEKASLDDVAQFGYLLGRFQELTADPYAAERTYSTVLGIAPTNLLTARALAALRIEGGDQVGAMAAINILIRSTSPPATTVNLGEALVKRAEIYMWERNYSGAAEDLDHSFRLLSAGQGGADEQGVQIGSVLNLSAGLQMQIGNFKEAENKEREALAAFEPTNSRRAELTALTNLVGILSVSGQLREPAKYEEIANQKIGSLADLDRVRGNFFITRGNLAIRRRNLVQAQALADAAKAFYDRLGAPHYDFRLANLECLFQKITYLQNRLAESQRHGEMCITMLRKGSPGKADNICDSYYFYIKANTARSSDTEMLADFNRLAESESKTFIDQRINLTYRFASMIFAIRDVIDDRQMSDLSKIATDMSRLEYETGVIYDAMNDILLSIHRRRFAESGNESLAVVSGLRREFGAAQMDYE